MVKKATFVARKPAAKTTKAAEPVVAPAASRARRQVDPALVAARAIAGRAEPGDTESEEAQVEVNIPKAFNLTDDNHVMHAYGPGKRMMPVSHAEHFYAKANGVTIV